MIVYLPDFHSATVEQVLELLMKGQIKDGSEDTKEEVVHLAKIFGIKLKLERSLDSDSSLVDQISEDISIQADFESGTLRRLPLQPLKSRTSQATIL